MLNNVIDLSHHNTVESFQEARLNGIVGVIHKATQGRTFVDAKYHARRARALANGLLWGAYHFGVKGNVPQQVEHFLETVNPTETDLLVLDFEPNHETDTMTLVEAERFVTLVNEKIGRFPGLYSGQSFLRQKLGRNVNEVLRNCFLWIARYSSELPIVPPTWETFTFWQYSDGNVGPQPHQVPGIGRCDRNKFNGDLAGLKRLWGVGNRNEISPRELSLLTAETARATEATMTEPQCSLWRSSDVRVRIRAAVAEWAKVSPNVITSSQKLKELAHPDDGVWGPAQQGNLIAVTNNQNPPIFRSVVPEDDQCEIEIDFDMSGDTTVLEWENIVWTNQNPETFCKRMFG